MIAMPLIGLGNAVGRRLSGRAGAGIRNFRRSFHRATALHTLLWNAHFYLAFAFFAVILLHVAAALFHALIRRDGVFESMAPTPSHDVPTAVRTTHAE